eukprot:3793072-Alexandrium_andersonii.AAC.1
MQQQPCAQQCRAPLCSLNASRRQRTAMMSFSRLAVAGFLTSAQLSAGYYTSCVPPMSAQTGYNLEFCNGASAT